MVTPAPCPPVRRCSQRAETRPVAHRLGPCGPGWHSQVRGFRVVASFLDARDEEVLMHLRAGAPVLWREDGATQIGTTPGRAVVLSGLEPAEQRVLEHLGSRADPIDLGLTAHRAKASRPCAERLAGMLVAAGVVAPDEVPVPVTQDEIYWDALVVDARARSRCLAGATVGVLGSASGWAQARSGPKARPGPGVEAFTSGPQAPADPLVLALASHLAEAGVGAVLVHEDQVTTQALERRHPALRAQAPLRARPEVTVCVSTGACDVVQERRLLQEDLSHLLVRVRETGVEVGPLVVPGRTACGLCVEMWHRDADPAWPVLTVQMRSLPRPALEALLTQQAAVLAARMVLDALTGRGQAWWGASVELSAVDPLGVERRWEPHPDCGCVEP